AGSCHSKDPFGKQCEHFHLNCLPSDICIHKHLKIGLAQNHRVDALKDIIDLFESWGEYLYFENSLNEAIYYPVKQTKIPSHFLRTLICQELSTPEKADWQKHQSFDEFLVSYTMTQPLEEYLKTRIRLL
ncbi:MAG: hypothetical protein H0X29_04215, partial [Parachlamydiaceae bacterium]|nr:hypothetical protein [Parachlamydiaceae bacterium]